MAGTEEGEREVASGREGGRQGEAGRRRGTRRRRARQAGRQGREGGRNATTEDYDLEKGQVWKACTHVSTKVLGQVDGLVQVVPVEAGHGVRVVGGL